MAQHWREPFFADNTGEYVLLHNTPITTTGTFLGMIEQVLPITGFSKELVQLAEGTPLVPFILYGRNRVLAHPALLANSTDTSTPNRPLPLLSSFNDPVLQNIWSDDNRKMRLMATVERAQANVTWTDQSAYAILHRFIDDYGDEPWIVGFYFDLNAEHDTVIDRLLKAALGGLGVFLFSILCAILLGKRLGRPVAQIASVADQIGEGRLKAIAPLPESRVADINAANLAINKMVADLDQQQLIRDTLGRYLPEPVAREVLRENGELTPQSSIATILFCDLAGFTSLAERLGASATVDVLNAYFSEAVGILEKHKGVVTQFQGDGILAVFNLPLPNPQHARSALDAAQQITRCADSREFLGHRLSVRIGLCTGEVLAGAVGASGRLSYTVHGNAVNTAARIEALNKLTNTRILLSSTTAMHLDTGQLKSMGEFEIRGKVDTDELFTVADSA